MALTRREVLKRTHSIGTALLLGGCSVTTQAKRPNVLFVMTDDQTVDQMSCYGNQILHTPNMDRIAQEGVRFRHCFCTNSLCAPSRATVLTGCYSNVHGVRGNSEGAEDVDRLNPDIPVFPQLLQRAGYRTGLVGKWHIRQDPVGFDDWRILPGQGVYVDPEFIENGVAKQTRGYATDVTTDKALEFLRGLDGKQPFCLLYQHKAPHRPFTPARRHAQMFEDLEFPYPETFDDDYSTRRVAAMAEDMRFEVSLANDYEDLPADLPPDEKKRWIFQRFVKDHYRTVYGVDENLGRVLDALDELGVAEDTLVIYTSDNGYFLGEHGWYDKRFMYEPALRIPLVIRYPRLVSPGAVVDKLVLNVDFAPTILDFADISIPDVVQGRSLRPLLERGTTDQWRASVYYSYYENSWRLAGLGRKAMAEPSFNYFTPHRIGPHRGVRTDRYKLIEYYSEGDYWELFDLQTDPHEVNNLYGQSGYEQTTADLKQELRRLQQQFLDTAQESGESQVSP